MDVSGSGVGRKCELGTGSDKNRKPYDQYEESVECGFGSGFCHYLVG